MKNRSKKYKAFTLIELLIVIAIIGILASVVVVRLVDAKGKARDAAIMKSANAMMRMAQMTYAATGSYSPWARSWTPGASLTTCDVNFNNIPNAAEAASVKAACQNIIDNIGSTGMSSSPNNKFYIGSQFDAVLRPQYPRLSIMVALPYAQKFYCVGSNGGVSSNSGLNASCPGKSSWECSGCWADPNGGGN